MSPGIICTTKPHNIRRYSLLTSYLELGPTVIPSSNRTQTLFSGRILVSRADLSRALGHANITCIAITAYGMKSRNVLDHLGNLPLSSDRSVTSRYDIGLNYSSDDVPLIALTQWGRNSDGAQVPMLNQHVGSVNYTMHALQSDCKMVVYPRVLHQVKAQLPGGYAMPKTVEAFRNRMDAVYNCITRLSNTSRRNYRLLE